MSDVYVAYERAGDTYRYCITCTVDGIVVSRSGDGAPFGRIIQALSSVLKAHCPNGSVTMLRTDRPGLTDIKLADEIRDLIRDDPDRYLTETNVPDRLVVVRTAPAKVESIGIHINTGYDTLAESFGDHVYARLRDDGKVECLFCGRWTATIVNDLLLCPCVSVLATPVTAVAGSWVEFDTSYLANVRGFGRDRYYLPRAWNPAGWITKDELKERYNRYLKESEHVRE